jgi:hypothetical protein
MRRFLLGWKQQGCEQRLQAYIVNYADDFVILCRRKAAEAQAEMAKMMEKLKLEVNQQKTRTCSVPEESFDFLGYTLGRCYRVKTGQAYIGTKPSKKRVLKFCESISQKTQRETCGRETEEVIGELNLMLKGWANYFRLGSVSRAYETRGQPRPEWAAPMAGTKAQNKGTTRESLSRRVSLPEAWSNPADTLSHQPAVGER